MAKKITDLDHKYIWHPCSQMKDYQAFPPLIVNRAKSPYIELNDGTKLIDVISSWWCKNLGHNHPRLKKALLKQTNKFEHVIFGNTTNNIIVQLSQKLATLSGLSKILYTGDGSSAVEAAIKMSLHSRNITGEKNRYQILALENSYHGETGLALAATNIDLYKKPYQKLLPDFPYIKKIPYVYSKQDSTWNDCKESWDKILLQLEPLKNSLTAIIVEPILQGAGGMNIYSRDFLSRLDAWAKKHNIHLIMDEIMTGFGRTGLPFAFQYVDIKPDFLCVAKGLTSGWLPMSAALTNDQIYNLFYDDFDKGNNFLHSHTHSGNALAAAVALETLNILEDENIYEKAQNLEPILLELMLEVKNKTQKVKNIRSIGGMVAADLILEKKQRKQRYGYKIFQEGIKHGIFMRPLGNTIYWLPPLNIGIKTLIKIKEATIKSINFSF